MAILIKGLLFVFFAWNFVQNWPAAWLVNKIFVVSGDTSGYYLPVEAFTHGEGYTSFCRMPGLLPIYGPLYYFFGESAGKTIVIILQFLAGAVSVYALARISQYLFKSMRIFRATFYLYAFSSFVSIWDHYGYSDSFSISLLIFSVYFFLRYAETPRWNYLVTSGVLIAWSLFFRPTQGVMIPCMLAMLWIRNRFDILKTLRAGIVFVLPVVLALTCWTGYNYVKHGKVVVLQGRFSECFGSLTEDHLAVRELIIAWGGDYQEWSKGTRSEWFFTHDKEIQQTNPFVAEDFTHAYNLDSLLVLRREYHLLHDSTQLSAEKKQKLMYKIIDKSRLYRHSYIAERPFRYYLINRLKLTRKFIFRTRLDDLPFPKLADMSWFQVAIKAGYLLLLNIVVCGGIIGIAMTFSRKNLIGILPLANIVVIAVWFGFVEQRYLLPSYPFFCVYSAYTFDFALRSISRKGTVYPGR